VVELICDGFEQIEPSDGSVGDVQMRRHQLIGNFWVSQRADGGQHKRFVNAWQKLFGSSNSGGFHDEVSFCQRLLEFCFGNEANTEGAALAVGIDIAYQCGELVIYQPHDVAPNGTKTQQQNLHTTHSSQCRCTTTGWSLRSA